MIVVATVLVVSVLTLVWILRIGRRDSRLPPGPPTVPILGNAHQIPLTGLGKKYDNFLQQKLSADVLGSTIGCCGMDQFTRSRYSTTP